MNTPNLNQHILSVGQILVARETLNLWQFNLWNDSNLQKFLLIDKNFLTLKKERKEGAREYCTDESGKLLILKSLFIVNRSQETQNIETIVSVTSIANYLTD